MIPFVDSMIISKIKLKVFFFISPKASVPWSNTIEPPLLSVAYLH
jgi:hypothetical protein